jgi:hypothetical protein
MTIACRRAWVSGVAFGVVATIGSARAQQLLAEFANPPPYANSEEFGYGVAWAGDIDGDGVDDALIAAPFTTATRDGAVYVVSGATGSIIREHLGPEKLARLGIGGLAAGADLDGDGVPDYAVGTIDVPSPTGEGTAYVYSGATGNLLYTLVGEHPSDGLCCPRFIGDVDADGVEDLSVISPGYAPSRLKTQAGRAYIYSGATMTLLYTVTGTKRDMYMTPVAGIGDIDADGHADFVVGWDGWGAGPNGEGKIETYSGATGTMIYRIVGEATNDFFGQSESGLGDVDGDGSPDFMVCAYGHDIVDSEGRVYVYSGPSGALLYEYDGVYKDEHLGILPLDGRIDLNGDGFGDILIYADYVPSGGGSGTGPSESTVFTYSGRTGRPLYEFRGARVEPLDVYFGSASSAFGDFNHDGIDDVIFGAEEWNDSYGKHAGRAFVFGGNDLFLQANQISYAANDTLTLANRGGEPGMLSMIVLTAVNSTPTFIPILVSTLDSNGELTFTTTVPTGLSGVTLDFMGYAQKPSGRGVADSITETITFQ